ncbi:MAG TPA: NepR family anti-sigma factor [Bauldia sp.]|nr:NepR family anti-sigma factor [Bauldia sp.]
MPPGTSKATEPRSFDPPSALSREIQEKIGDQLRAIHDDIVKQGVPDRFVDLLAKLDSSGDKNKDQ